MKIELGKTVTMEYTLFDAAGNELDTSRGLGPLQFICGQKQILPALEIALAGLQPGDSKRIELSAKSAYGDAVSSAFKTVPLETLPEGYRQADAVFGFYDDNGQPQQVKVHEVSGSEAVLDFNHPLAGMDIIFEILVIDVE